MILEYFRPECQRPVDQDGYEIDSATREIAEIDAWLDRQRELARLAEIVWDEEHPEPFEPTDADWDDYNRWSGNLTDQDVAAGGSAIG